MYYKHITHPLLSPVEYYFIQFNSESDLLQFAEEYPWFTPSDISIYPPEAIILKHDTAAGYYERLTPAYFKNHLRALTELHAGLLQETQNFFR